MIYSIFGFGKGKTTSGIGTTIRAIENNEQVLYCQFLKDGTSGEMEFFSHIDSITTLVQNTEGFNLESCNELIDSIRSDLFIQNNSSTMYKLVVLDEVLVALDYGLISKEQFKELLDIISNRYKCDVYVTGRINHKEIRDFVIDISDIATNCYSEKHCYDTYCSSCNQTYPHHFKHCPNCGKKLSVPRFAKKGREF